jgi:CshA-type fibril repeat protein
MLSNSLGVSAAGVLTLQVDYTPDSSETATEVTPGNKVDLTAVAPVSVAGTTNQMVSMEIEPALVLKQSSDVRSPVGWTVSYSTNGSTWTTVAPTTEVGWAAIRHVKAEGPLVSEGTDSSGRQIASTDANAMQPTTGSFPTTTGSSGDGWDVFFDDQGRLFNVWHHNGSGINQSIDCYLRTGVRCHGTWPYLLRGSSFTMHTNEQSSGVYDPIAKEIWFPTVFTSGGVNQVGFACIRTDDITLTNKWCGGSELSAFVSAGADGNITGCISGNGNSSFLYDCTGGIAKSGNRIFSWHTARGDLMCVDISANSGAGAPCDSGGLTDFGSSLTDVSATGYRWRPIVMEWNGKIYGNGGRYAKAVCVVASTGLPCTGWTNARAINAKSTRIFTLPTAQGGVAGVCFSSLDTARTCFDENGIDITTSLTSNFKARFSGTYVTSYDAYGGILYSYNTRLYWGDSDWRAGRGKIYCWDFALDNWCRNWTSSGIADTNYQIVLDPYNPNCLWSNSHDGIIQTYDTATATMGNCAVPAPTAVFDAGAALPRMACAQANAIQEWKSFTLTADFVYTSATLSIKTESGSAITGWTNVAIPSTAPKTVNISTLAVATSGQRPTFTVTFNGRSEYGDVSARITAVGGSPELCLRPTANSCPTGPVFQLSELAASTSVVDATGTATAGTTITPFTPATATVNIGAKSASACSSSLSGTALTTAGSPVAGALVTLTNSAGTPLVYPDDYGDVSLRGREVSVVTSSTGQYNFPYVVPGAYAVRFSDVATAAVTSSVVTTGNADTLANRTSTDSSTTVTTLVSKISTISTSVAGVIDATYTVFPTLSKKFLPTTVSKGQISTLIFTLTNSPGNAAKTGLGFVDTLPAGLVVDTNANMSTTCPSGSTMSATSGVFTVVNASIASGSASCEYSIAVRADVAGTYTNDASNVTTTGLTKNLLATKVVTEASSLGKFVCNTNMYHVSDSQLYQLDPSVPNAQQYKIGPNALGGISAIGFNIQDGFMYGIARTTTNGRTAGNLVRINSSGVVTDLGAISGTTANDMSAVVAGDFDDSGNLVVKKSGWTDKWYSINVTTQVATMVTLSMQVYGDDIAYANGYFYTISFSSNGYLYRVAKSNWSVVQKQVFPEANNGGEALYTNGFGELIVTTTPTSSTSRFWRLSDPINVTAKSQWVLMFEQPLSSSNADGAMCHDNPVPTALPDETSGPLNTAQSINLLTNDIKTVSIGGVSANFDATTIRLCDPNASTPEVAPNCTVVPGTTITVTGVGIYVVSASGVVTFTPANGYSGTPPSIGYQVSDSNNKVASSTYTPTVTSTEPAAIDDVSSGDYDTNQVISPLTNDIEGSLGTLVPNTVRLCPTPSETVLATCTLTSLTVTGEGTYTVNADGTVTFNPLPSFSGEVQTDVKYVVKDTADQPTAALITATVGSPPVPTATNDSSTGGKDQDQTISPRANDAAGTGATLDVTSVRFCSSNTETNLANCTLTSLTVNGEGTYTVNTSTGVVVFDPEPNFVGTVLTSAKYIIKDITGQVATATIAPTVVDTPTADNETSTGSYDSNQVIDVLTGDAAATGATLDATSVRFCSSNTETNLQTCTLTTLTVSGEGTYTVNTTTSAVTFDPLPTFAGTATPVKYVVEDSFGQVASATITPTVSLPAPPTADNETSTGSYNTNQVIDVLTGDAAATGVTLNVGSVRLCATTATSNAFCTLDTLNVPGEGTYSVNISTGVVTFDPDPSFAGTVNTAVKYVVADSFGQKASATITPTVSPPNAPSAVNDTSSGDHNTSQTITPLGNDAAGTGATLDATSVRFCSSNTETNLANCSLDSLTVSGEGTYTVNTTTGVVTFVPLVTFAGQATAVKYVVEDAVNQKATATIRPTVGLPPPPTADNETSTGNYDADQVIDVLTGDAAATGATLDVTSVRLCATTSTANASCTLTTLTVPGEGTYTVNTTTGAVTFNPLSSFTGTATPVKYVVEDNYDQKASATITPTVGAPPLPTADDDVSSGAYDTNQTISPISNDDAGATDFPFVASTLKLCGANQTPPACTVTVLTVANEGTYTVNANGTVTFDPLPTFTGTATQVAYQISDSLGRITDALITPTVDAPTAPTATAQTRSVLPGGTATFTTITGTSGLATGTQLQTSGANATCLVTPLSNPVVCDSDVTITGEGTYTLNPSTGVVTFVASQAITGGTKTPITYRVTDITGQTATSTLTPVVPPAPVAVNDTSIGNFDTNQVINPLSNDTPGDASAPLVASTVKLCGSGQSPNTCNVTTLVVDGQGTYTVNANGTVTFDPLPTFIGLATAVRYQVADSLGQVTSATITVTVRTPPDAVNDVSSGNYDTDQLIDPLTNDVNGSGTKDATSVKLCSSGQSAPNCNATSLTVAGEGTYTVNTTTGVVTFNPLPTFTGTATPISYQASDSFGQTDSATITPTVGLPPLPIAVNDTSSGNWDTNQTITPTSNDTVGSSFPLLATTVKLCGSAQVSPNCNVTSLTVANEGTYTVNANGTVTFDPLPTFKGTVTQLVTYQATDSLGRTDDATITPTVTPPPAPVATPDTEAVIPGGTATFTTITGTSGLATGTQLQTSGDNKTCLITPGSSPPACEGDNVVTITGEGTFTLNPATGVVTFVADTSATAGTKTALTYRVTDVTGQTATSTLTPVIPQPPVANPDTNTGNWDTNQTISPLTNDTAGAVSAPLVASTVKLCGISPAQSPNNCSQTTLTVASQGTYTVNANGTVTFDPLPTFNGTATAVRYQVADTLGQVANTTITPTVLAPRAPTANPDTNTGNWDTNQTISSLTNDTPGEPTAPLVASTVKLCGVAPSAQTPNNCTQTTLTITSQGTYTVNANGTVTFDPLPSFTGTATAVKYQVTDVIGQTVNTTITPTVLAPPAPVASPGTVSLIAGGTKDFAPIFGTNALAAKATGGPDLTNSTVCIVDPATTLCGTSAVTIANEGTFTLNPTTGVVTYTALSTATSGPKTAISYKITDALNVTVTSTLTPSIIPKPTARPDTSIGVMEQTQTLSPAGNDSPGVSTYPLDATTVLLCESPEIAPSCTKTTVTVTGQGTYVVNANGLVSFTPVPGYSGTATPMPYILRDSLGQVAHSTLNPIVLNQIAPITELDEGTAEQGSAVVLAPWSNDNGGEIPATDTGTVELVPESIRLCGLAQTAPTCTETELVTDDGTYTVDTTTGKVTFVHRAGFMGTVTQPVTYQIEGNWTVTSGTTPVTGNGITTNILIPTIIPPAPPAPAPAPAAPAADPWAVDDVSSGSWDTNHIISVFANDEFLGSSAMMPTLRICADVVTQQGAGPVAHGCDQMSLTVEGEGTYTVNEDGTVTFDPLPSFHGTATPIRYQATDLMGRIVNSFITPTVEAPPVLISVENELPATGNDVITPLFIMVLLLMAGLGLRSNDHNS